MKSYIHKFTSFFTHPLFPFVVIFLLHVGAYLYITLRPVWITNPGTKYAMPRDQTMYVSYIRQAKDGSWCPIDTHTTRSNSCTNVQIYFVFLGKIAALFRIDPVSMYLLSQLVGGIVLYWTSYFFIVRLLPKSSAFFALLALFLFQLGPSFPIPKIPPFLNPPFPIAPLVSAQITFLRIFGLPHHTLGEALGLFTFLWIIESYRKGMTISRAAGIFIGTVLSVTLLAPFIITLTIGAFSTFFLFALFTKTLQKLIPPFVLFGTAFIASMMYLQIRIARGAQNVFVIEEKKWWPLSQSLLAYLSSILLFLPFIFLAAILLFRMRKQIPSHVREIAVICFGWIIFPLIFMPATLLPFVPLAHFRLVDGYQYIPPAMLTGIGLMLFRKSISSRRLQTILPTLLLSLVLAVSFFLTFQYFSGIIRIQELRWTNLYVSNSFWDAVQFFSTTGKGSKVLIMEYMGQLLADYAPIRTYLGQTAGFPDWRERHSIGGYFFRGTIPLTAAEYILKTEDIDYVYFGHDEQVIANRTILYPTLLTPIFTRSDLTIYVPKWKMK